MEMHTLRVYHYGATPEEDRRITLSPANVAMLASETEDVQVQGRTVRNISVLFVDGGSVGVTVAHDDLELLEATIGAYCFDQFRSTSLVSKATKDV